MQHHKLLKDDAISPVIGTILMIAATVIIAGAVYGAVTLYSGKQAKAPVDAGWKAQAIDANPSDGLDDTIKVSYVNGPNSTDTGVTMTVKDAAGTALVSAGTASHAYAGYWNPGDYATYKLAVPLPAGSAPTTVFVTITQAGNTMLDQQFALRQ